MNMFSPPGRHMDTGLAVITRFSYGEFVPDVGPWRKAPRWRSGRISAVTSRPSFSSGAPSGELRVNCLTGARQVVLGRVWLLGTDGAQVHARCRNLRFDNPQRVADLPLRVLYLLQSLPFQPRPGKGVSAGSITATVPRKRKPGGWSKRGSGGRPPKKPPRTRLCRGKLPPSRILFKPSNAGNDRSRSCAVS
jgi:hypothetical protein